jgi:hypothetical protein
MSASVLIETPTIQIERRNRRGQQSELIRSKEFIDIALSDAGEVEFRFNGGPIDIDRVSHMMLGPVLDPDKTMVSFAYDAD